MTAKILAFSGSSRRDSFNKKLVTFAADQARKLGGDVTLIDLRDFAMPLYDGDLEAEQGPPEGATQLFKLMKEHQGLLLACPEYNSSITPLLKNAIDWVSRPREGEQRLAAFTGKVAGLLSASPGQLGGLRGLVHVRSILSSIGTFVVPGQVAVSAAHEAFDENGSIRDSAVAERIEAVVAQLVETTAKLNATQ
ncbi:NADPH-dependent FMN reductase [Fuerstiella marisgermanici]|uniref:FMN-dependent NADPH-azoreductase n=1 Tax=Fuerstiella marisgermanici TaxID=1891926 RepID=A0A1P8WCF7_9PLAN|nr:NAD(P)H-dependent oxidoreductase [Fuerstiella marisgermanici]APZ91742.1 FMN-dependent NADPH-azoreductase [Fuerstiella marisgermanici]